MKAGSARDTLWYKDAVIYETHVKAFFDSNHDGVGDFKGLTQKQKYRDARIIFTDTEKSNWAWDPEAHAYYWHRFFAHQPDLNFDSPTVVREILNAMRFWLDMGVDGLRLDAIPYLVERDGTTCEN